MDIRVLAPEALASQAADLVAEALSTNEPTIGLAGGATPRPLYDELARRHRARQLAVDHARYVLLDEYVGLPADHPASFRRAIRDSFTIRVGIPDSSLHAPEPDRPDAAERYEELLTRLPPREIQILGIGRNGHIGFNEPGSPFDSRTRIVTLADSTVADNRRQADTDLPTQAITMGIGTILEARHLLLLATGSAKSAAIAAALQEPPSEDVPASALQLHPRVTVLLDADAASGLGDG